MEDGRLKLPAILVFVVGILLGSGLGTFYAPAINQAIGRDPDGLKAADAVLESVQARRRLVVLAATFVVTKTAHRDTLFGMINANKTLIVPGVMRYELDWTKVSPADLSWDKAAHRLTVKVPELEISGPDVQLKQIKEYRDGGLMLVMTNVERELDAENRSVTDAKFIAAARNPLQVTMARQQARDAVRQTFLMPMLAVGIQAPDVVVHFPSDRN